MKLHDYQKVGVAHLHAYPRAGLLLDMGLGKTAVCLTALRPQDLPVLVAAPPRVAKDVWDVECEKWRPDLRLGKAVGTPAQRRAVLADTSYDVVVISQENLRDPALAGRQWTTLILDELSGYKTRGVRWKAAKKIIARGDVENVWGLTGTPAPNGYEDLWPQMYLLDSGHRLGRTLTTYRQRHFTAGIRLPTGAIIKRELLPGHDKLILAELDNCLSMNTDGRLKLPPHSWNEVDVPMPPAARRVYDQLKERLVVDLRDLGLGDLIHTADTAAKLSNRLSQICAGFLYEDVEDSAKHGGPRRWSPLHTARPDMVEEIVDGTGGSPVLVAYAYQPELAMLQKKFGKHLHTIHEPDIIKRWNAGQIPILAAHPASIGHGLNLQDGGHTAVWMSPTWNLELWEQFNKRLNRQGQQHPVVTHLLSSPNTIDARVYRALYKKTSVQKAILDYLESPV